MTTDDKHDSGFRDGMPFLGGSIWIDLLNSTLSPDGVTRLDFLASDLAFARWLTHAGVALDGDLGSERRAARELREALRPAFDQLAVGKPVPKLLVARINALLAEAPFVRQLDRKVAEARYLAREVPAGKPHRAAAQIAADFARFLSDHEPDRLKHCANPACTMVFYDRSKNSRRRWCLSAVCGNRDKVANYRARKTARG